MEPEYGYIEDQLDEMREELWRRLSSWFVTRAMKGAHIDLNMCFTQIKGLITDLVEENDPYDSDRAQEK